MADQRRDRGEPHHNVNRSEEQEIAISRRIDYSGPAGLPISFAIFAVTTQQDLGDFTNSIALLAAARGQLHVVHAGDAATIDAYEVRMPLLVAMIQVDRFEPPNVVAKFGPPQQAAIGQIVQVSKRRRLVETTRSQAIGKFSMSHRRLGCAQLKQRCDAGGSSPEPRAADVLTCLLQIALRNLVGEHARFFWIRFVNSHFDSHRGLYRNTH
jgi:hypothetical protein